MRPLVQLAKLIEKLFKFIIKLSAKTVIGVGILVAILILIGNYLNLNQPLTSADAIIVVSGGDTVSRTEMGIDLYQAGWANLLIFSGAAADPKSPSNAEMMKKQALTRGVPESAIIIDDKSVNTSENAREVSKKIESLKLNKVILVSSGYHIRRAQAELKSASPELNIIARSSKDANWNPYLWWLTPYGWWITPKELVSLILVKLR